MCRWDTKGANDLPECMKFALGKILDSYETIANMLHQGESYRIPYLRYLVMTFSFLMYIIHFQVSLSE
jgi:hypothetical protein